MKTIAMIAALIAVSTAAHAAEPLCWAWAMKGDDLTCEQRAPSTDGQAAAIAREAQAKNNRGNTYQSITTTTNSDGSKTSSTTTTTFPRGWPYSR